MNRRTVLGLAAVLVASPWGCYLVDTSGIVGGAVAVDAGSEGGALDAGAEGGAGDDSGLLAYWSFDEETNGFVRDLTGHGHDGQLGTPALLAPGMDGGQALASTMTVTSLGGQNFPPRGTLSFWLTADYTGSQVNGLGIFDTYDPSRPHLFVRVPNGAPSAYLQMACQNAGQQQFPFVAQLPNLTSNTWTHLVFAWDSVHYTAAVYVDGNLLQQGDGGFSLRGPRPLNCSCSRRTSPTVWSTRPASIRERSRPPR
jgi:hypothetical protein